MSQFSVHQLERPQPCPCCGRPLKESLSTTEPPKPGDILICMGCTEVLTVSERGGELRSPTLDELIALDGDTLNHIGQAIAAVRAAR